MRIGVVGCAGRMGRTNLREVLGAEGVAAGRRGRAAGPPGAGPGPGHAGRARAGRAVAAADDLAALLAALRRGDRVLHARGDARPPPRARRAWLRARDRHDRPRPGADAASCEAHAQRIPIVWAPNMSLGVNLLLGLVEQAAPRSMPASTSRSSRCTTGTRSTRRPAPPWPSGEPRRAAAQVALEEVAVRGARRHHRARAGRRRSASPSCAAATSSATIAWCSPATASGIELAHIATDRAIYARGAVRAARWAAGQPPGLYGMARRAGPLGRRGLARPASMSPSPTSPKLVE